MSKLCDVGSSLDGCNSNYLLRVTTNDCIKTKNTKRNYQIY